VRKPFEPATNGVLTWLADDALLYQVRANCQGRLRVHGGFSAANRAHLLLRELVDMLTPDRPSRLADAPPTDLLAEAQQNGRRARFANMTRFRDDIAWRFGHASVSAAGGVSRREPRRLKAFTSGNARPFQQRARENFERTVGAAS
jgi:hypothetical protein